MSNQKNSPWTPEIFGQAKKLAEDGCSGSEIAKALGMTRNQVIGKLGREKISIKRKAELEKTEEAEPLPRLAKKPLLPSVEKPLPIPEPTKLPSGLGVSFEELRDHHCRYIIGHMRFCDQHRFGLFPYCEAHTRICYQKRSS